MSTKKLSARPAYVTFLTTHAVIRAREFAAFGGTGSDVRRLVRRGRLRRIAPGVYVNSKPAPTVREDLLVAALRTPHGAFCLETALHMHGLLDTQPDAIWMALEERARKPRGGPPTLRVVRTTGVFASLPSELLRIDGVDVQVLTPAATVVHAFARRDVVDEAVAAEALHDLLRREPVQELVVVGLAQRCGILERVWPHIERIEPDEEAVNRPAEPYPFREEPVWKMPEGADLPPITLPPPEGEAAA